MVIARRVVWATFVLAFPLGFVRGQDQMPLAPSPHISPPVTAPRNDDIAGGFGGWDGRGIGGGGFGGPSYSTTWYPSRSVSGQAADLGLVRQRVNLGMPVWRDGGDMLMLGVSVRHSMFFTDAILPDTRRSFPNDLWNVSVNQNYRHKFDNGWSGGLMTGVGSASDRPFDGAREMNVNAATFLRVPAWCDRDSWMFSILYSSAGNLNIPIPGVAYAWNPSDGLHVNIGVPFSVMWRPVDDLTFSASYVPLTDANARATYRVADGIHLYGGYEFLNEAYNLADRADTRDRFMGFEQRFIGGVRRDVWRHATLDLNAGYAFDRHYGEGRNQGSSLHDRIDVAPGAFLGAGLRVRF